MRFVDPQTDHEIGNPLTPKQLEVARLASRGVRIEDVASQLSITVGTAKLHLHQVYKKLGINSRVELVLRADEFDRVPLLAP